MKFTILSQMDRLAAMAMKTPITTIPVLDEQKQLDDDYRDQIEILNLKLLDQEDTTKLLTDINERLRQRDKESHERITSYQATVNENSFATARCTSLESDVRRLEADLKTETSNRDHFRQLVAQQDAFITEAKRQITEFKNKKEAELKSKVGEAEHLAKQAIRLNEENSKLLKDNVELSSKSNQLNEQTPLLMEENRKYREQTTRLIEEKRKLEEQVNQLNETDKVLRVERSITSYKDSIIETLKNTLKAVHELPCIRWRTQNKLIRNCAGTVNALQGNIDNIRENKIVPQGAA